MRKLEASLADLRGAVEDYAVRLREQQSTDGAGSAVRPSGGRTSGARIEAMLLRLRNRIAALLRAVASKVLGGRR